ncbi:TetR/AcrR family transcriptional regulator [Sandaracinobacteroides saxicola]|uniref:TetR/AcrR family transcriptional regulator n=1 Tax=Sandaracinobacteroides saxicola TaxID=2759707 RepID=A0A7G5IKA3_9SPHN|nr:TetR/AcrR family transcriptional regulator [Sandaracinobacteroides saxicola]QMW23795.1 TetR/AcrR family transcriptional regulator [Sandaracinobacteroides saxicola]
MENSRSSLSREDWIEAARLVLIASGVDDVKVDRLAKKLNVSRGSFYWHFKHRKDLLDALLSGWETQNRNELAQIRDRNGQGDGGVMEAVRIWLSEDPAYPTFDMAIRFWARKSPEVARLVRQIDEDWIIMLAAIFEGSGEDRMTAIARARVNYFHQIGYYALAFEESLEDRLALAPYYHRVLTGHDGGQALAATIDDLRARAGRNPPTHG